jgi:predicted RNA-binding protein
MFIINQENWEVVKKTNVIGSNNKNKVDLIQKDDLIIIYAIRPLSSILGAYKVITKKNEKKVNFSGGSYPYQLKLEPIEILKEPIGIISIVDKLDFIKRKDKWHTYLFGVKGIRKLSKKDYDKIINSF